MLVRNHKVFNQTTSATPIFHAAWPGARIICLSSYLLLVTAPPRPLGLMMWPQCARQQLLLQPFIYLICHQRYLCLAQTLLLTLSPSVPALLFTSTPLLLCTVQQPAARGNGSHLETLEQLNHCFASQRFTNFFTLWPPNSILSFWPQTPGAVPTDNDTKYGKKLQLFECLFLFWTLKLHKGKQFIHAEII